MRRSTRSSAQVQTESSHARSASPSFHGTDSLPPLAPSSSSNNNSSNSSPSSDDVPTLTPATPLRRTRSQTKREAAEAEASLSTPTKSTRSSSFSLSDISPVIRARTIAAVDVVKQSCTRYQLLAFEHVPDWLKDNRYITSGYRANIGWRQSCESVCHFHNETVNVWTHIIAFLVMSFLLVGTMVVLSPHGVDRLDLDVVVSSRSAIPKACEGLNLNAPTDPNVVVDEELRLQCAEAMKSPPAAPSSGDPLALLHEILGDNQDEMLVELLSRVQTQVPNLEHLTQTLKEKALAIQQSLPDIDLGISDETSLTFHEYISKLESTLTNLKSTISDTLTPSSETSSKAEAAKRQVQEGYSKLKDVLSEFSRDFSPDLLQFSSPRNMDLVKLTETVIGRFMDQAHWNSRSFSLSPSMVAMPAVKVKPIVEGMDFGTGGIFGHATRKGTDAVAQAIREAVEEMDDARSGAGMGSRTHAIESELRDRHDHVTTVMDADGKGQTASTAIGYMTLEAHTSSSNPGMVQLQLHSYLPRYPLAIFIVTAMICLFFSSAYHLLHAVSDVWAHRFQAMDYCGIVLLIAGSTHPIIYYGFYCSPLLKMMYISTVWILALIVFTVVILPSYRGSKHRVLKVVCFICLGFSGCVPLIHFNLHLESMHFIVYWLLVMGFCYLSGAAIYVTQVPERWWPGYFDYIGSSHQLWHLSIFAAVLVHYFGLIHMFEWRMQRVCTADMWS